MAKTKKNRFKISQRISDHLIEAILIFASVFFAFWLTEYRESRNESSTLEISLQHIASEMEYNHNRVESIFEYHSNLILEIDSLKNQTDSDWEKLYGNDLTNWHGMQIPMLRSTAYQTFLNSNVIDNTEFELAKILADIYNSQSIIERLDNSFFELATTDKELTALPKIRHLAEIYVGILPDLMMHYQHGKKNWLEKYGYNMDIKSNSLKSIVDKRMLYR
jgi:hypothetical protein